jgi:hypothetical protein
VKPHWFRLLEEQRYGKGITAQGAAAGNRLGLTVSFLMGALRNPRGARLNQESVFPELRTLLRSMMHDHPSGSVVRIYECDTLRQPTACLTDLASGSLGDSVTLADGVPSNLFAWQQYFSSASRKLESLVAGLCPFLEFPLCAGQFSYRDGSYQEFSSDDEEFIKRAMTLDEDDGYSL